MKKRIVLMALLSVTLSLSACNKKEETTANNPKREEVAVENVQKRETFEHKFPLTGIETNEPVNQRAVAVMINNHPNARPQSGLHKADLVYEVLAEGNITRFLAIYQSEKPEIIGPIRSARDYYVDLSKGFNAIYICHGWSPEAKEKLEAGEVDSLNGLFYDGTLFWRADFRKAPHNSYISFKNILKGAEEKNYETKQELASLPFLTETENLEGEPAEAVTIAYSTKDTEKVEYVYDSSKQKYKRYSGGEQTVDRESSTPILLDNVLIVEMEHQIIDNDGRRGINLTSGGKGYLLQKGIVKEIEWKNVNGRILPFINGEKAGFVPGKTWINIIPTKPGLLHSVSFKNKI
jgi:Protein of unknown function (DUF3048) N-terminal domain/Protein of unknown function (DUF3048) C-terminal domain